MRPVTLRKDGKPCWTEVLGNWRYFGNKACAEAFADSIGAQAPLQTSPRTSTSGGIWRVTLAPGDFLRDPFPSN